jgi:predicted GTPase
MDLPQAAAHLERFKKRFKKKIYPVSAFKKQGLEELIAAIRKRI